MQSGSRGALAVVGVGSVFAAGAFVWAGEYLGAVAALLAGLSGAIALRLRASGVRADESEKRFRALFEQASVGIAQVSLEGRFLLVNEAAAAIYGRTPEELYRLSVADITHPDDVPMTDGALVDVRAGRLDRRRFEKRYVRPDGTVVWAHVYVSLVRDERSRPAYTIASVLDITAARAAQTELEAEVTVLDLISREAPLPEILERITLDEERKRPGMLCSILLLDAEQGTLRHGAAPSLPAAYSRAVDGLRIGPEVGSCGTAAYTRRKVIVADIATDPKWAGIAPFAMSHGLRACWSHPVIAHDGAVLGTFAMYYAAPRSPGPAEERSIERAARLAGIAIERARAAAALREREAAYRLLADNSSDMIARLEPGGAIRFVSPACVTILGVPPDELIGRDPWERVHPDERPAVRRAHDSLVAGADAGAVTHRMRRAAGDYVWLETRSALVRDAAGAPSEIVAVSRDITERRRAEERLTLLNRELAHRVKNNLAALQALCEQTLRRTPDPAAFSRAFTGRMQAMARMQDLLRETMDRPMRLSTLVHRSLEGYLAGEPAQIELTPGPDVLLPARAASVLHMALHELATNAVKHGALSRPEGRVGLRWALDADGALSIAWEERGGPPVTTPATYGFGGELITGGVRFELAGRTDWRFEPDGVRCLIAVPAPSLRDEHAPKAVAV